MTITEIKKAMLAYTDFYGSEIMYTDEIKKAKTRKELAEIIDRYRGHLQDVATDAESHLENFKKKLGISIYT